MQECLQRLTIDLPYHIEDQIVPMLSEAIAGYEQFVIPASAFETRRELTELAMSCRMEQRLDHEWKIHLNNFLEDLENIPLDIIQDTCRFWRKTEKFWPTIAEFLKLAEPKLAERLSILGKLKILQNIAEYPRLEKCSFSDGTHNDWSQAMRSLKPYTEEIRLEKKLSVMIDRKKSNNFLINNKTLQKMREDEIQTCKKLLQIEKNKGNRPQYESAMPSEDNICEDLRH